MSFQRWSLYILSLFFVFISCKQNVVNKKTAGDGLDVPLGVELVKVTVDPKSAELDIRQNFRFTVKGTYSNEEVKDLTDFCEWSTKNENFVSVGNLKNSNKGIATANNPGATVIEAKCGENLLDTANVTVKQPEVDKIEFDKIEYNFNKDDLVGVPFTITVIYKSYGSAPITGDSNISYTVIPGTTPSALTIDRSKGIFKPTNPFPSGYTSFPIKLAVRATYSMGGKSYNADTTVSIGNAKMQSLELQPRTETKTIMPNAKPIFKDLFTPFAVYSTEKKELQANMVFWSSSDPKVATVSNVTGEEGWITPVGEGTTTISANFAGSSVKAGEATFTVNLDSCEKIKITPANPVVPQYLTQEFEGSVVFKYSGEQPASNLIWSTSKSEVAEKVNTDTFKAVGDVNEEAIISATHPEYSNCTGDTVFTVGYGQLQKVEISVPTLNMPKGTLQQAKVFAYFQGSSTPQDVTNSPYTTFYSNDTELISISNSTNNRGTVMAGVTKTGQTGIYAKYHEDIFQSLAKSSEIYISVTPAILQSVSMTPKLARVPQGQAQCYTVIGTYSDSSARQMSNEELNFSAYTPVYFEGNCAKSLEMFNPGGDNVRVASVVDPTIYDSASLAIDKEVLSSIAISPETYELPVSKTVQLSAYITSTLHQGKAPQETITWLSSDTGVATISSSGLVSGVKAGKVTITAKYKDFTTPAYSNITVKNPDVVTDIRLVPGSLTIEHLPHSNFEGLETVPIQYLVELDNSGQYIVPTKALEGLTFTSSNIGVATVALSTNGMTGEVKLVGFGNTSIMVTYTNKNSQIIRSAPAIIDVVHAELSDLTITPEYKEFTAKDQTQQYSVLASWSNGVEEKDPSGVIYKISSGVGNGSVNATGLFTALEEGEAKITATYYNTSINATAKMIPQFVSINIAPLEVNVATENSQQFTVSALHSFGTYRAEEVVWTTSNNLGMVTGSGYFTAGTSTGDVNVIASVEEGAKSNSATVHVVLPPAKLTKIVVTPSSTSMEVSNVKVFSAAALDQYNKPYPLTNVTWAFADNSLGCALSSNGTSTTLTSGNEPGNVVLTATSGSVVGKAYVEITPKPVEIMNVRTEPSNVSMGPNSSLNVTVLALDGDGNVVPNVEFDFASGPLVNVEKLTSNTVILMSQDQTGTGSFSVSTSHNGQGKTFEVDVSISGDGTEADF